MVCWVTWGSLHQHLTAHQPFRTSPCKSCLQGPLTLSQILFLGKRKTLHLRKSDIFSKIQGNKDKARETALSLPRNYWNLSSLEPGKRRGWCGIRSSLLPWLCLRNLWAFHSLWEFFFCSLNHCWFWLIQRMGSGIHCFSSFRNHSPGFDTKPAWLKAGPTASLKIFLNLSTISGWFSNLKQKPRSGKVCKFLGCIRKYLHNLW